MDFAGLLDQKDFVLRNDPKGMYRLTSEFDQQCARAMEIARASSLPAGQTRPDLVLLTGLGGSAAGGDFVRALFEHQGVVPFQVNRDYSLPAYVGPGTVVFATSYSGNTEETLAAYYEARHKGASIVVVTSGGKLAELAKQDGFPRILIPGGQPPRTALGYMLMPVVHACIQFGWLPAFDETKFLDQLRSTIAKNAIEVPFDENPSKQLAAKLFGKVSVIYGLGSWQALVANRWKGQINENSKNMTFANAFPELNHNEILGWVQADAQGVAQWQGILLTDGTESAKMKKRFEVTAQLIEGVCGFETVVAPGESLLEKMVALALIGDYVSLYLAALNDVDPENIDHINTLKSALASVP